MKSLFWRLRRGCRSRFSLAAHSRRLPSAQRAITIDDYFQIQRSTRPASEPRRPSGSPTPVKTPLLKDDKNEERIWMVPAAGGDPIALTGRRRLFVASALESRRQSTSHFFPPAMKAKSRSGCSIASAAKRSG